MAISVVQRTTGTNQSVTVSGVTAGNSLLVAWIYGKSFPGFAGSEATSDNHGNSYSNIVAVNLSFAGEGSEIFLAQNVAGGVTTITISGGYSSYVVGAIAYELSGVGGVDTSNWNRGGVRYGGVANPSSGSITTGYSGDFVYTVTNIDVGTPTVPSGYTSGGASVGGAYDAYSTQSSPASIDVTWGGSISYWGCGAVALYAAAPTYSLTWNGVNVSEWDGVNVSAWDGI